MQHDTRRHSPGLCATLDKISQPEVQRENFSCALKANAVHITSIMDESSMSGECKKPSRLRVQAASRRRQSRRSVVSPIRHYSRSTNRSRKWYVFARFGYGGSNCIPYPQQLTTIKTARPCRFTRGAGVPRLPGEAVSALPLRCREIRLHPSQSDLMTANFSELSHNGNVPAVVEIEWFSCRPSNRMAG